MAVTANKWKINADGDWSVAKDWSLGTVPKSSNNVTISTANVHTITHGSGSDVVNQLIVGSTDHFVFSGGSLEILSTASFADGYTQTGGVLQAHAVAITGPGTLTGGSATGATAFTITGSIAIANYTLGGATVLNNSATINQTGQIALGDTTGTNATINNGSKGTYTIAGDYGVSGGATSARFINGGTLRKSAGSGTTGIGVNLTSTGTLSSASGNLEITGAANTIKGTVSGAGQISFGGGSVTTFGAGTLSVGTLGLYDGATVNLTNSYVYAGTINDSSFGTTTLNLFSHTLRLTGTSVFFGSSGSASITGSGTFTNSGTMTMSGAVIGGTLNFINAKVINQTGNSTVGDGTGNAPTMTNTSAGIYSFTTDASLGDSGATAGFDNQGTLRKSGGNGTSDVSLVVTSSGTIGALSGTLEFDDSLINTGTISGAGAIEIAGNGVASLDKGTVLSVAAFEMVDSATLDLGASLTYAGVFTDQSFGTTHINLGANTWTLSNALNAMTGSSGSAVVGGTGTLANTGTLQLANVVVDGTATIKNTGTINQTGTVTIGGAGGLNAAITNAASKSYNIAGSQTIRNGVSTASHFDNSGKFTVAAGSGTAAINTNFNNLSGGVVTVSSGTLENDGTLINAGTVAGTRLTLAGTSQTTLSAGSSLTIKEIDLFDQGMLTLATSLTYSGTFDDAAYGSNTLDLGSSNLTLTGTSSFGAIGSDVITGSGTLKISRASFIQGGTTVVGGTAELEIASRLTVTGQLQVGDSGSNAASALIDTGGIYNITADSIGISRGASAASTLTNNGLFEKTAGTGTSLVSTQFVNNGTLTVTSGTLEFLAGTLHNNGTINGTRTTDSSGNIFISHA